MQTVKEQKLFLLPFFDKGPRLMHETDPYCRWTQSADCEKISWIAELNGFSNQRSVKSVCLPVVVLSFARICNKTHTKTSSSWAVLCVSWRRVGRYILFGGTQASIFRVTFEVFTVLRLMLLLFWVLVPCRFVSLHGAKTQNNIIFHLQAWRWRQYVPP
jgi:hypothetical protein